MFGSVPDPSDALDNVRIEYAGALTGTIGASCVAGPAQAAFQIVGGAPVGGFLTNSTIAYSAKDGVYSGWIGNPVDFLSSNSFIQVSGCDETFPHPAQGLCPASPPCPK